MKFNYFFIFIFFLFSCSNEDETSILQPETETQTAIDLFNIDKVPNITLEFEVADWNKFLNYYDQNPQNDKKVVAKCTLQEDDKTIQLDSIGIKMKGNTSRRRPEGTFGQTHNASNPDWHHCHFGLDFDKFKETQTLQGLRKINLKWFKDDAAYVREVFCYDLFKRFGVWTAPKSSYCKLTIKIKGDANPAYFGVYQMLESVDEEYIINRQQNWSNTMGFLFKCGYAGSQNADFINTTSIGLEDVKLNAANSVYFAYDLKTREDELTSGKSSLINFISDLNSKSGNDFKTWIDQKMDINLFLKTYATSVVLGMWDDYWINGNNFYFYMAGNGKVYFIPYDYDNTLGTSLLVANSGTQNPLNWGNMTQRPLINKIMAIPEYQTLYKNYISELISSQNDLFHANKSKVRIIYWQNKIAPFVSNDTNEDMNIEDKPASWGNQPNYRLLSGNTQGGNNGAANYFESRIASIPW